jgi:predicted RNA binding protein YcfA (HicA-like mRNA interferase family)
MSDKKHIHILNELYAHPIAHNLKWKELIPGLASIGFVYEEKNGAHHFARNGHTVVLGHANHEMLDTEEILKLRHFIAASAIAQNETPDLTKDIVVAMDYHKAIIFHAPGTASETRAEQHADQSASRVLHKHPTSPPFTTDGPEIDDDYYTAVVNEMSRAKRIVILGHGTGSSNASSQLVAKITNKNPEISHRIAAVQHCDLEAMTEPQMISLGIRLLSPEPSV